MLLCCAVPAGRVEISAQNHNFAVDPDTLPEGVEVTHVNLNDGTCAGMVYPAKKAMTIQVSHQGRAKTPVVNRTPVLNPCPRTEQAACRPKLRRM